MSFARYWIESTILNQKRGQKEVGPMILHRLRDKFTESLTSGWRLLMKEKQPLVWVLAVLIGLLVSYAVLAFRILIGTIQYLWSGAHTKEMIEMAGQLPWYLILLMPAFGGLIVGCLLHFVLPHKRPEGVADVIEARAMKNAQMPFLSGLGMALVSAVSLGFGASAGREGPAVHLGATLASSVGRFMSFPPATARTILGCGVAAAVSASFNAPLAGMVFALEVVLAHYALTAFIPIAIASVVATAVTRLHLGDFPAFIIPEYAIATFWEIPAFAILGLTCGLVAISFQSSVSFADWTARRVTCPLWLRPVIGGLMIGAMAIFYPQILGVGYEATDAALKQSLPLTLLLTLLIAKTAATAITLASRFGGGVFSPSLYLGAMAGGAFGVIVATISPDMASSQSLYAILGMGAVSAAVLGAPISTILIVFELTGGYQMTIALILCVSMSSGMMALFHSKSFFHWQLSLRGIFLNHGPHQHVAAHIKISEFMKPDTNFSKKDLAENPMLTERDSLEKALRTFDQTACDKLPVYDSKKRSKIIGSASLIHAQSAYNKALIELSIEQHK